MANGEEQEKKFAFWTIEAIRPVLVGLYINAWREFLEKIIPPLRAFGERLFPPKGAKEVELWDTLFGPFIDAGILDADDYRELRKFKDSPAPFNAIAMVFFFIFLWIRYTFAFINASSGTLQQTLNAKFTPNPPDPSAVLRAAFIAPERTGEVRDALKRFGLSDHDIDLMFLAFYRLYSEETIRTLYLRKEITEDEMFMRMRELGYTDTRIREIVKTWEVIPPITDILTMVGREAFEPDQIRMMGLMDEFPEEVSPWLEKQGLSRYWQEKYWVMHWQQPSIQMGYEMLHRGIIGEEELDLLFRTVEIPPFWRDKLKAISFQPLTRVDVRRMHALGVIDDERLIKAYKDLGYDDENARLMAEFTKQYNTQEDRELSRSQITKAYRNKLLTRDEAKDMLVQIGYDEARADFILELEDYREFEEYQEELIKIIGERYMGNLITLFDARRELAQLNLPATRVEILLKQWEVKKIRDSKIPSKTDLDKFLRNGIISEDEYRSYMQRLGYTQRDIDNYLQLVKMKKAG